VEVDRGNAEDARGDSRRRSKCRLVKHRYARSSANKSSIFPARLATARTLANIRYTLMWGMQWKIRNMGCKANEQHRHTRVRKEDTDTE
jgi:hypothetical protein